VLLGPENASFKNVPGHGTQIIGVTDDGDIDGKEANQRGHLG